MDREISPPPTKKRRLQHHPESAHLNASCDTKNEKDGSVLSSSILSVYSWNINGIAPFIQRPITSFFSPKQPPAKKPSTPSPATASLRDFLRRNNWPTILCLQEVKIAPTDTATQQAVERAVQAPQKEAGSASQEPSYTTCFNIPTDPHNALGFSRKIYGVSTLIRTDFLHLTRAKTRSVPWDKEGRVLLTTTSACPPDFPSPLAILNLYCVNGTSAPYKIVSTDGTVTTTTRHDRKREFHRLLLEECTRLESEGYSVIMAGDFNVARAPVDGFPALRTWPEVHVSHRKDFNDKFLGDGEGGLKAVDTFRSVHGEEKKGYTYYPRGRPFGSSCDRVDMVICSASLKDNIADAGILETEADRGPSDHCPLFATFNFESQKRPKVD